MTAPLKLTHLSDTVIALATPSGTGAIAVVRISGDKAIDYSERLFSKSLKDKKTHTLHFGYIRVENEKIDEVVVGLFKAPHSYTGEDIIEISCHCSAYIIETIIGAYLHLGCRLAERGEFTRRAFLNKKIDLIQAEAVCELIASATKTQKDNALHYMSGHFSAMLRDLKKDLIRFAALMELELDFSEEDVIFAERSELSAFLLKTRQTLQTLIPSFQAGNVLKNGIKITLIGAPNTGKSTLLNALLREEKAIVSPIAGTTRDSIEDILYYKDICFRFIDTAGLRTPKDEIERIGIERTRQKIKESDMLLYLFDLSVQDLSEIQKDISALSPSDTPYIIVGNKADLITHTLPEQTNFIHISAQKKQGIHQLLERIYTHFMGNYSQQPEPMILTNARHTDALKKIDLHLAALIKGLEKNLSADLLSVDIRYALHHIGALTGDIPDEAVLDYIFSNFCIGK